MTLFPFSLSDFERRVAAALNINLVNLEAEINAIGVRYPDASARLAAVQQFLAAQVGETLAAMLKSTIEGFALDLVNRMGKMDPTAWQAAG